MKDIFHIHEFSLFNTLSLDKVLNAIYIFSFSKYIKQNVLSSCFDNWWHHKPLRLIFYNPLKQWLTDSNKRERQKYINLNISRCKSFLKCSLFNTLSMEKFSMLHLISFSRYQTKCVLKFLFRQLIMSWTFWFFLDQPLKQCLTGRKRGEDEDPKTLLSQEQKQLFWWKNSRHKL